MKLYDYLILMPDDEELTVFDKDYDMESYFYSGEPNDKWDKAILNLTKLLTVKEIKKNGIVVNLSEIIEDKIKELNKADLFIRCDIDSIMDDMESILSGNVSEDWMERFVDVLK